jgi:signal peptidase
MTRFRERVAGPRTRSVARSTLKVLGLAVLVAALVPFLVFAVPQTIGADHSYVILSGSMEPRLSPGDVVIVDASADVSEGDIITFDDGNAVPTTHRVIDVVDGAYITQGDANENPDAGAVPPDAVLGRVTLAIPLIGHVVLWVNTPTGYVGLVLLPLGLLLASELYGWARRGSDDPEPKPAIHHVDGTPAGHARSDKDDDTTTRETITVAVADLKLTVLAMAGLVGYAALNVYREVTGLGVPDPISVGTLTGGLLGLGFAVWVTVSARMNRSGDRPARRPAPAQTDGGTTEVER